MPTTAPHARRDAAPGAVAAALPLADADDRRAARGRRGDGEERVYFPGLNALRAYAAVAVLVHHVFQMQFLRPAFHLPRAQGVADLLARCFPTGQDAVILFFVLSGFLITYLLLAERQRTGTVSVGKFYARRVLRIWPLYAVLVILGFAVLPHVVGWDFYKPLFMGKVDYGTLLAFFVLFLGNVAVSMTPCVPIGHLWSVGVEEQFYLIWPWLLRLFSRRVVWVLLGVIAVKLGLLALVFWLNPPPPPVWKPSRHGNGSRLTMPAEAPAPGRHGRAAPAAPPATESEDAADPTDATDPSAEASPDPAASPVAAPPVAAPAVEVSRAARHRAARAAEEEAAAEGVGRKGGKGAARGPGRGRPPVAGRRLPTFFAAFASPWYALRFLRLESMALGGLAACAAFHKPRRLLRVLYHPATALLVAALLAASIIGRVGSDEPDHLGMEMAQASLDALFILCFCANPRPLLNLDWKPVDFVGRISYGVYMYHVPVVYLVLYWVQEKSGIVWVKPGYAEPTALQNLLLLGAVLVFTLVISTLSFYLMERPFLRLKHRFTIVRSGSPEVPAEPAGPTEPAGSVAPATATNTPALAPAPVDLALDAQDGAVGS